MSRDPDPDHETKQRNAYLNKEKTTTHHKLIEWTCFIMTWWTFWALASFVKGQESYVSIGYCDISSFLHICAFLHILINVNRIILLFLYFISVQIIVLRGPTSTETRRSEKHVWEGGCLYRRILFQQICVALQNDMVTWEAAVSVPWQSLKPRPMGTKTVCGLVKNQTGISTWRWQIDDLTLKVEYLNIWIGE